jgi:SAM-dependent methyltransferase
LENVPGIYGERRFYPRPWDYNFVLMRSLAGALRTLLRRHVSGQRVGTAIDFGCGSRPYEKLLRETGAVYKGADLASNPDADLHLDADGRVPMPSASCELILSSQVLEHVLDIDAYLGECARLLCCGGFLLLSTHGMWTYHPYPVDVRRWTRWGLEHEIAQRGFEIVETISCVGPLAYTTQLRLQLVRGALYQIRGLGGVLTAPISLISQGLMLLEDRITPRGVRDNNSAIYVVLARRTADGAARASAVRTQP